MNRDEYLRQLEYCLYDINEEDRREALDYYRSYFDDAGRENEQEVIKTLGTPENLSSSIKDSLNDKFDENIELGNDGIVNDKYVEKNEVQETKKRKMDNRDKMIFIILIIMLLIPLSTLLNGIFGIFGLLLSILLFFFGFWIATFALYVAGALLIAFGALSMIGYVGAGLILMGTGFILIALGSVINKLASWFFKELLPFLYQKVKDLFSYLMEGRLNHEGV